MDEHENRLLRTKGLAFFGAIMAGQSHEVTNVLNIINELIGLQGDVLAGSEHGPSVNVEKLEQITAKVQYQVKRGGTIVDAMNRFAHSADSPATLFDLKEALQHIVYLAQRPANLRKTTLEPKFPDESMPLETSPFGFMQAVFLCLEIALAASAQKRHIAVDYEAVDGGANINIDSADPIPAEPDLADRQSFLTLLMQEIGGKFNCLPGAERPHRFTLFVPRAASARYADSTTAERLAGKENCNAG